MIVHNCNI